MRFIRNILLCLLATSFFMTGCVKENVAVEQSYGYIQFKLYKEASYVKAVTEQLEYLSDVTKIRVTLKYEDNLISQTLLMNAFNEETAEFGLRSDKLKLLAGSYELLSFSLYDKMDNVMYESTASDYSSFDVVPGDLWKAENVWLTGPAAFVAEINI